MVEVAGKRIPKWLVVLVAVLLVGVLSGTVSRCTGGAIESERAENAANQATQPQEAAEPLPGFKVVKVDDVSVGATPRFDYRVVVSGQPTPEQLTRVAEAVFKRSRLLRWQDSGKLRCRQGRRRASATSTAASILQARRGSSNTCFHL